MLAPRAEIGGTSQKRLCCSFIDNDLRAVSIARVPLSHSPCLRKLLNSSTSRVQMADRAMATQMPQVSDADPDSKLALAQRQLSEDESTPS